MLLSIDPSINNLGWAVFGDERQLLESGCIHSDKNPDQVWSLSDRITIQIDTLQGKLEQKDYQSSILQMIIEEPEMFASATSSAAVHNSSLKKLIMTVGALVWFGFEQRFGVTLVPVTTWKGQLSKSVTTERVNAKYGRNFQPADYDEADAVALGDWYITHKEVKHT